MTPATVIRTIRDLNPFAPLTYDGRKKIQNFLIKLKPNSLLLHNKYSKFILPPFPIFLSVFFRVLSVHVLILGLVLGVVVVIVNVVVVVVYYPASRTTSNWILRIKLPANRMAGLMYDVILHKHGCADVKVNMITLCDNATN